MPKTKQLEIGKRVFVKSRKSINANIHLEGVGKIVSVGKKTYEIEVEGETLTVSKYLSKNKEWDIKPLNRFNQ